MNRLGLYAGGTTTPLGLAASLGHIGLVRFLLASGADPAREVAGGDLLVGLSRREPGANARRIVSTILRSVEAKKGHAAMVALAERRSSDGWTPLAHAAFVGDLDVLQELLDHGASARGEKEAQSPPGDEDRPAGQ